MISMAQNALLYVWYRVGQQNNKGKGKQERKTIIGIVYSIIAITFVALGFIMTVFGESMTLNNLILNEILSIKTVGFIVFFSGFIIFLSKFYN